MGLREGRAPCAGQVANKGIVFPGALGTGPRGRPGPLFTSGWVFPSWLLLVLQHGFSLKATRVLPAPRDRSGTGTSSQLSLPLTAKSQGTHRSVEGCSVHGDHPVLLQLTLSALPSPGLKRERGADLCPLTVSFWAVSV